MGAVDLDLEDAIDAAIAMIDVTATVDYTVDNDAQVAQWGSLLKILSVIRAAQRSDELGWGWVSYEDLKFRTGMSVSTIRKLLGGNAGQGGMWRTLRMLERGPKGAGTRSTAWRVRHPTQWRRQPWREKNREVRRLRLGFFTWDRDEQAEGPETDSVGSARLNDLAARSLHRAASSRENALAARSLHRAASKSSAARKAASIARLDAQNARPPPPVDVVEADASPPWDSEQEEEFFIRLVKAIESRGKGDVRGRLKGQVVRIVRSAIDKGIPCEDLERWAVSAPDDKKSPMTVAWVQSIVVEGQAHLAGGGSQPSRRAELERRIAELRAEIDLGERTGGAAPTLWDDLAACENELAAIEEGDDT